MSQTAYNEAMTTAVAGMVADGAGAPNSIVTRIGTEEILMGVAVANDTDDGSAKLPDGAGVVISGVAIRDISIPAGAASADNSFPSGEAVPVMRKGRIWVVTEVAVQPGDAVYARYTANGGNTQLGAFRNDDDTAKAIVIAQARWISTTGGAGIALLEINLP